VGAAEEQDVNEATFTIGDLKEVATSAAQEAAREEVRSSSTDELRAIAKDAADEVIADRMKDGYERTQKRWEKMSRQERSARLGQAFAGQTTQKSKSNIRNDNLFLRMLPFQLAAQKDKGNGWTWQDVIDRAGTKGLRKGGTVKDEEVADLIKTAVTAGDMDSAGAIIPPQMSEDFIEFLYASTVLRQMGARTVVIEGRSIDFGKQGSTATHYWVGEGYPTDESAPDLENVRLELKESAVIVAVTNQALNAVQMGLENIIQDDMIMVTQLGEDIAMLRGKGSSTVPTGILHQVAADNKFDQSGTDTGDIVFDLARAMYKVYGSDVPRNNPGWALPERERHFFLQLQDANNNLVSFAEMVADGELFGADLHSSSQIPTDLGGGTETEIYFGEANQLIIGEGQDMNLDTFDSGTIGNKNLITQNMQASRLVHAVDSRLRHGEAFSVIEGVTYAAEFDS